MRKAAVTVAAVVVLSASYGYAFDCGVQRWDVKTTTDDAAQQINTEPVDTTIAQLGELERPDTLKRNGPRAGAEFGVYTVAATLVTYFSEDDGDLHLVLADDDAVMVAEIPHTQCVYEYALFHDAIHVVRKKFLDHFNGKLSKGTVNERVIVTGVGFFDARHNVSMAAPNFIELHPVIDIKFAGE